MHPHSHTRTRTLNAPVEGDLVGTAGLDVAVERIVADVGDAAGEPLNVDLALGSVKVLFLDLRRKFSAIGAAVEFGGQISAWAPGAFVPREWHYIYARAPLPGDADRPTGTKCNWKMLMATALRPRTGM